MKLKNNQVELIINETILEPTSLKMKDVEFLYQKDAEWKKNFPTLFPICGMLINDHFTYQNQNYNLKRHGFFREITNWKIIEQTENTAVFQMQSNEHFKEVYPWEFELTYRFEVLKDGINLTTTVKNLSSESMFYSLGYHPAFITKKTGVMNFNQPQNLFTDSQDLKYLIRNPQKTVKIQNTKVSNLDFTGSQFFYTTNNQATTFEYADEQKSLILDLSSYINQTYILWSESNEANYICFEPMNGHADFADRQEFEISQKDQIISLNQNQERQHFFNLKIAVK